MRAAQRPAAHRTTSRAERSRALSSPALPFPAPEEREQRLHVWLIRAHLDLIHTETAEQTPGVHALAQQHRGEHVADIAAARVDVRDVSRFGILDRQQPG